MNLKLIHRTTLCAFLGSLCLQFVWVAALPPYRGADEFDHAYRADAVANGYWKPSTESAEQGRGGLVPARRSIVLSANSMCDSYEYTGRDNCFPGKSLGNDRVSVASGAADYFPLFYWYIGVPAQLGQGLNALLVMRGFAAILCSALFATAVLLLKLGSRTNWPTVGLIIGSSPVVMYSTAVAAPNGLEMVAGTATWAGLIALGGNRIQDKSRNLVLYGTTGVAMLLAVLRPLGPLWLILILAACLILYGPTQWISAMRLYRLKVAVSTALVIVATAVGVIWTFWTAILLRGDSNGTPTARTDAFGEVPLWMMQSVAAFPLRNQPAPLVVYAIYALITTGAIFVVVRCSVLRVQLSVAFTCVAALAVPLGATLLTIDTIGTAWQGRYALPFSVGFWILSGIAVERWVLAPLNRALTLAFLFVAASCAHLVSALTVLRKELGNPAANSSGWWPIEPNWLVVAVALAGCVLIALATTGAPGAAAGATLDRVEDEVKSPPD